MYDQLKAFEGRAFTAISGATTLAELEDLRTKYLGQGGELMALLAGMGSLEPGQRLEVGAAANASRKSIEIQIDHCRRLLS
jgi:phenylalanyl-tRNA synthetase alpha chain